MPNGDGGGFDLGSFFAGLGDILNGLIAAIWAALIYVYEILVAVAVFLYGIVLAIEAFLVALVGIIWRGLKWLWSDVIFGRFKNLFASVVKIWKRVANFMTPFINIAKNMIWAWKQFITRYIMPVIKWIQRVRSVLAVLRLFHVKWAMKLDRFLLDIQSQIMHDVQLITKTLNEVLNVMELIVDPTMLIRQNVFLGTFMRGLSDLLKLTTGQDLDWWTQDLLVPESTPKDAANMAQHMSDWNEAVTSGTGWMADGGQYSTKLFDDLAG